MKVNELQNKAIHHVNGPCMVLAGPGSGKTTVITQRVKYLIEECDAPPEKILVITFTKASATEMKTRFCRMFRGAAGVSFGTFHALFFKIIRYAYHYDASSILREDERLRLIYDSAESLKLEGREAADFVQTVSEEISRVKGNEIPPDKFNSAACSGDGFVRMYSAFTEKLASEKKLDFDDMMLMCLRLFEERRDILEFWQQCYEYILIDEFQDISPLQYKLIMLLAKPQNNIFVVGDDDQSIYSFRGAAPEMMFRFEKDFKDTVKIILGQNYRCGKHIVEASAGLISHNKKRFKKMLTSEGNGRDSVIFRSFANLEDENNYIVQMIQMLEREGIEAREIAVLYRTNSEPRSLIRCLKEQNISFTAKETVPNIFNHWIAKNFCAYMEMAEGNITRTVLLSVMNRPKRYITRDSLKSETVTFENLYEANRDKCYVREKIDKLKYDLTNIGKLDPYAAVKYIRFAVGYEDYLKEYAKTRSIDFDELKEVVDEVQELAKGFNSYREWKKFIQEYGETLREAAEKTAQQKDSENEGVNLMTFHSAKGLEFDTVFILDASEDYTPYWQAQTTSDIEEERRMFYVAMTRAKKHLYIVHAEERYGRQFELSRFVSEAGINLNTDESG